MKVYTKLQNSKVFIEDVGQFPQDCLEFFAQGATDIVAVHNDVEVFDETWSGITDVDGNSAGISRAEVLEYLEDQLVPIKVSAVWGNSDTTTNLNTTGSDFLSQYVPFLGNELKPSILFSKINDETFECNFAGEIMVHANVYLNSSGERAALEARMVRDPIGAPISVGPISATGYIRNLDEHNRASLHITYFSDVSVGDKFSLGVMRGTSVTSSINMPDINSSQIQVTRLR